MTRYNISVPVIREFEIAPVDGRKSFYGKAHILETENGYYLQSYSTMVCYIDKCGKGNQFSKLWNGYSVTTMRHINAFMRFNGLNLGGKSWWCSLANNQLYTISEILNICV